MTNNKQQTAVDWLAEKTFNQIELLKHSCINEEQFLNNMLIFREQAKEIEKEQIAKAFDDGDYNYHYSRKTGDDFEDGKEYYQEVYG